ncbi:futalosine hydrolase [Paenibacillus sp. CAA11]|uniref:futalosine hydrolase n=1 Tax=Paenibacillus sp. CAA11 TaxID=1532905 RepID=UPI000D38BC49|nr:futalosine hydrolase [Paenibacillus sp. CAA11]AWB43550.1 futalosine hydrolase [Paenibacillus sp. CAA11]
MMQQQDPAQGRILIMAAVEAEASAILRGLKNSPAFDVRLAGVGPVSAAIRTAQALIAEQGGYRLVLSAGIGGGYPGRAELGSLVVSTRIVGADLGAETADGGFSSLDELGFGSARVEVDAALAERTAAALASAGLPVHKGAALTLATVTGTAETAAALGRRFPDAASEGMEGYGVAAAAHAFGLPALELRAISNAVGPRDRAAWRIGDALQQLEAASSVLLEVLS